MKNGSQASEKPPRHVLCWQEPLIEMVFRLLPAGEFYMGSRDGRADEEPVHLVRISQPFWIAETPVTHEQFALWPDASRETFPGPGGVQGGLLWEEAMCWCAWLNQAKGAEMPLEFKATLPTEAQWEYACRAGTETEYNTGDGEAALAEAGWYAGNARKCPRVGEKKKNQWALYDMHGNVWEWCRDVYDKDAYKKREDGVVDPEVTAKELGKENPDHVLRGGSWRDSEVENCRSSSRYGWNYIDIDWMHGFRACLVRGPTESQMVEIALARKRGPLSGPAKGPHLLRAWTDH